MRQQVTIQVMIESVRRRGVPGLWTLSFAQYWRGLLPRQRQVQSFLRGDEVIVAVLGYAELHPVNLAVKNAGITGVV